MKAYKCPKCMMKYDKPGKCSMDGETLISENKHLIHLSGDGSKAVDSNMNSQDSHHKTMEHSKHNNHHGHNAHHKMMMDDFKTRFIFSMIVTIPILFLSPLVQQLLNFKIIFAGDRYVLFILASFIFFWGGWPFLNGLYTELKQKKPGMMTLIALAISVAYFYSTAVVFGLEGKFFFWELATLIDVMLLGHWIEMKSVLSASRALEKLAELMPNTAHLVTDKGVKDINIKNLKKGDIVLVRIEEKIPADGVIVKGSSYLDESMLTGESKTVKKEIGSRVIGGSMNGKNILEIKVTGIGQESYLAKVVNLVKEAQEKKSKTEKLADIAARWLTIVAITVGAATFFYWLLYGPSLAFAIERLATVMVIACPHALGLAIPLVNAVSTSVSAKNGLLIKDRTAFENARKITAVVFDKTGTLTKGNFGISKIEIIDKNYSEETIIQLASSLEKNSEHPIASSIVNKAKELNVATLQVTNFKLLKGEGIEGKVDNNNVKLLSKKASQKRKIILPKNINANKVATLIYVVVNDNLVGIIVLEDQIRKESFRVISRLQQKGIKCYMLTGDNKEIAKSVSEQLKLDGYFAEVLPHEKQEKIQELQEKGEFVAMTGDGINDAPALALADVGIAIGSGTDIAAETADIILVNSNPEDVVSLIEFGKKTYSKIIQNLIWATGYNVFAIPLAAGVLMGYGIVVSPAVGAALMSLSTVVVAVNAKLLKIDK